MIVANTLISLHLGRHWRWKCDEKRPVYTADDIQVYINLGPITQKNQEINLILEICDPADGCRITQLSEQVHYQSRAEVWQQ